MTKVSIQTILSCKCHIISDHAPLHYQMVIMLHLCIRLKPHCISDHATVCIISSVATLCIIRQWSCHLPGWACHTALSDSDHAILCIIRHWDSDHSTQCIIRLLTAKFVRSRPLWIVTGHYRVHEENFDLLPCQAHNWKGITPNVLNLHV